MIKLNLLPASYQQKGTVKAAAFVVLIVWVVLLIVLFFYTNQIANGIQQAVKGGDQYKDNQSVIATLVKAKQAYDTEYTKDAPETEFVKASMAQPPQFSTVMKDIALSTTDGIVIEKYTITPNDPKVPLTAWVRDDTAFNRWRLSILSDADFTGVPQFTRSGGSSSASTPGAPGQAAPASAPPPAAGGTTGASSGGSFFYPQNGFPRATTATVTVTLNTPVSAPAFSAAAAAAPGGAAAAGAPGAPGAPGGGQPAAGGAAPASGGAAPGGKATQ